MIDWLSILASDVLCASASSNDRNVMIRNGMVSRNFHFCQYEKILLDTGASNGNYIGDTLFMRSPIDVRDCVPCKHSARLGDGESILTVTSKITLQLHLYANDNPDCEKMVSTMLDFFVVPGLGNQIIVGRKALLQPPLLKFFISILTQISDEVDERLALEYNKSLENDIDTLHVITPFCPVKERSDLKWDPSLFSTPVEDTIVEPWTIPPDICPEDESTPLPVLFPDDIIYFMETTVEQSRQEHCDMLNDHISKEFIQACPEVIDFLQSDVALDVFAPREWKGIKVDPIELEFHPDIHKLKPKRPRPIRMNMLDNVKKELDRLGKYMLADSKSAVVSPMTVAPKTTEPFLRICGDYKDANTYVVINYYHIPKPEEEIKKASAFRIYIDLDLANSFHQLRLGELTSLLLSVSTPFGPKRPLFMPEGVGPASFILQQVMDTVFADFKEWMVVIFDNILILANDYADAFSKLKICINRCHEYNVILKLKKSWFGVTEVTFFGYKVGQGSWELSDGRRKAIELIQFPQSKKEMQSFLGASIFFHRHVPNFSEWSAKLYEMTHQTFVWDPNEWSYDYEGHFMHFRHALVKAFTLYFPDYSLEWIVRTDASDTSVGGVLFQVRQLDNGESVNEPLEFTSKKFSDSAKNWDVFKKEAFGIYHTVTSFTYHLRGKKFTVETDHRNLQWIEQSIVPIVVRWRNLLQSFDFVIRHIPRGRNEFADYLSKLPRSQLSLLNDLFAADDNFEAIMSAVHGDRQLHFGAYETWRRAKEKYPDAVIRIQQVRDYVKECPTCQKTRETGIKGLPARTLSLKPATYRYTVGVDHVSITPEDRNGNKAVILIVEHFAHFPQAYAVKSYDAETLATVLFRHYCTFGLFDSLVSDPGSAMMSDVVKQLNHWLGVAHKVSLVHRHESNGCEASGREFIRHLRALVNDTRLKEQWSDDTVLPLINFALCSHPTSETGGFTPFELKYGTEDAAYFRLPQDSPTTPVQLLRRLDANLRAVRARSHELQQTIKQERASKDHPATNYAVGDLVLFNTMGGGEPFNSSKLTTKYAGPYRVIQQAKNDIKVEHVVTNAVKIFHVDRVKPFFGSDADATRLAEWDDDQFEVESIEYWVGNAFARKNVLFAVRFQDGDRAILPLTADLATNEQLVAFINRKPALLPLRYARKEDFQQHMSARNREPIAEFQNDNMPLQVYLDIRYFDGRDKSWVETLPLLDLSQRYLAHLTVIGLRHNRPSQISVRVPFFDKALFLTHIEVDMFVVRIASDGDYILDERYLTMPNNFFEALRPWVSDAVIASRNRATNPEQ